MRAAELYSLSTRRISVCMALAGALIAGGIPKAPPDAVADSDQLAPKPRILPYLVRLLEQLMGVVGGVGCPVGPLAGRKAPTSSLRAVSIAALTSILGGCIASETPLITTNAVYPFEAGSVFETYRLQDGAMSPSRDANGISITAKVEIVDGYYRYASSDENPTISTISTFKVSEVANSSYLIAMHLGDDKSIPFYYSLVEKKGEAFISYHFSSSDFENYRADMQRNAPDRWARYTSENPWRTDDDGKSVRVDSLRFLEIILPEMAARGFHVDVTAYKAAEKDSRGTSLAVDAGSAGAVEECDRLAANPADPQRRTPGVDWGQLDAEAAIRACRLATGGDPTSARLQYQYGRSLEKGENYTEALKWYGKAADQEYGPAMVDLGLMHAHGTGVAKNDTAAVRWYQLATAQGYTEALPFLGLMYLSGRGVPQDPGEAIRLFRQAADQNNASGQYALGGLYLEGRGVERNLAEAGRWFRLAADQGMADAQVILGALYQSGQGVKQDFGAALRLYRLAADRRNPDGQVGLGVMYQAGQGVQQDLGEAARLYRLAADQGNANGQFYLGLMYEYGFGVPYDPFEASRWYKLATKQGHTQAKERLPALDLFAPSPPKVPETGLSDGGKVAAGIAAAALIIAIIGGAGDAGSQGGTGTYDDPGSDWQDGWNDAMQDWGTSILMDE